MAEFMEAPENVKAIIYNGRGLKSRKGDTFAAKVVFGIDSDKRKTNVVHDNNPVWNEEGEFKVNKSDKAVFKFKLYDGDEVVGVIKIPVNELSEERHVKSLPMEPYKKGQPQPAGELSISAFVINFKSVQRRKSTTLGGKIKAKMSNSNLNLKDDASSMVSGESKTSLASKSKMSTMKKKIFNRKKDGINGAQSMMNLATGRNDPDENDQAYSLNPFLNDTDNNLNETVIKRPESKFQTLPVSGSHRGSVADVADHVSVAGSEQSSIPGSAASMERKKEKNKQGGKSFVKALKKPFGNNSRNKERSKSMWDISNLPVEGWEQKMEHRLSKSPTPGDADTCEDQGIYLDNGSESSNFSQQQINNKLLNSSSTFMDSGIDVKTGTPISTVSTQRRPHLSIDSGADLESGKFSAPQSRTHSRNNSTSINTLNTSSGSSSLPTILITDLIPNKGSNNGGTKVAIIGSNFGTNRDDFKSVKICGCDVTRSIVCNSNSKFTVTTSMWTSGSGFVEVELIDGRRALSKQTFEFVSVNQLTDEAKNIKVPSFNSNDRDNQKKKSSMNNLANARRKFSASTLGLNTMHIEDDTNPFTSSTSERKKAPEPPVIKKEPVEKKPSPETVQKPVLSVSGDVKLSASRNSLCRNSSDRYDPSATFQSKKELEEEILRLRSLVQELTDKNLEMNLYLEELLIKVMSSCPEILQK